MLLIKMMQIRLSPAFILSELWLTMPTFSEGCVNYVNEIDEREKKANKKQPKTTKRDSGQQPQLCIAQGPKLFLISKFAFPSTPMPSHLLYFSTTYLKSKPRSLNRSWLTSSPTPSSNSWALTPLSVTPYSHPGPQVLVAVWALLEASEQAHHHDHLV